MRASKDARIYIQIEVIVQTMLDFLPNADACIYIGSRLLPFAS
jgi:hypothetical protein